MIENIWNLLDHNGRVKIITKKGMEHTGTICCIQDVDEDDDYIDECLCLECADGIWGIFVHEIEDIVLLDE